MTPRITLVHGWGYDATLWHAVLPLLVGLDVEVADLGYFGRPARPGPCGTSWSRPRGPMTSSK